LNDDLEGTLCANCIRGSTACAAPLNPSLVGDSTSPPVLVSLTPPKAA
jgi:hypothetical protein